MSGPAPNRIHTKSAFEKRADKGDERQHHAGQALFGLGVLTSFVAFGIVEALYRAAA
jgi:hypothetical protein